MVDLFTVVVIVHIAIWIFVATAFLHPSLAKINLYYVIPIIFFIHMLPLHPLSEMEQQLDPKDFEINRKQIGDTMVPFFSTLQSIFEKSWATPISPQGMLIFGALLSAYTLKNHYECRISNVVP